MRDYKKEVESLLDEVKKRKQDRVAESIQHIQHSKFVCIFGVGTISYPIIAAIRNFTSIKIDFICDNDQTKWGQYYHNNLKCISPDELAGFGDEVTVLIATQHYKNIYEQLKKKGLNKIFVITEYRLLNNEYFQNRNNIEIIKQNAIKLIDILEDKKSKETMFTLINNWFNFDVTGTGYSGIFSKDQYYPSDIIKLCPDEVFVDAGAYNGDTLLDFIVRCGRKFESISAFELDKDNYNDLNTTVNKLGPELKAKIKLFNVGLLDEEKEIFYTAGGSGSESTCINIIGAASKSGKTVRLSDILKKDKVTFIKMDIEGSELQALRGAEEIIRSQKPKLAVCVYHKPEHLWEIPLYLKGIVPEYKIFFRHHTVLEYETVCYAVI